MLFLRKNITKTLAKCILRNVFLQNLFYLKKISPELQMHPSKKCTILWMKMNLLLCFRNNTFNHIIGLGLLLHYLLLLLRQHKNHTKNPQKKTFFLTSFIDNSVFVCFCCPVLHCTIVAEMSNNREQANAMIEKSGARLLFCSFLYSSSVNNWSLEKSKIAERSKKWIEGKETNNKMHCFARQQGTIIYQEKKRSTKSMPLPSSFQ